MLFLETLFLYEFYISILTFYYNFNNINTDIVLLLNGYSNTRDTCWPSKIYLLQVNKSVCVSRCKNIESFTEMLWINNNKKINNYNLYFYRIYTKWVACLYRSINPPIPTRGYVLNQFSLIKYFPLLSTGVFKCVKNQSINTYLEMKIVTDQGKIIPPNRTKYWILDLNFNLNSRFLRYGIWIFYIIWCSYKIYKTNMHCK